MQPTEVTGPLASEVEQEGEWLTGSLGLYQKATFKSEKYPF